MNRKFNQIDESIGRRLRDRRTSSGLSQEQLAERLQIDPNDIELYETGAKRISADRLLRIAKTLGVRPTYFFGFSDKRQRGAAEDGERPWQAAGLYQTLPDQGVRLNRAFIGVKSAALREAIITFVVALANSENTIKADSDHAASYPAAFGGREAVAVRA